MTAPDHVRILVADSHPIVRLGVADSIHTEPDLKVTGEAASGDEVIALLRQHQYDVILLDIAMPGKNGLDTLHAIRQIEPTPAVLIFSEYPESLYAISMLRAGAKGFISKSDPPSALTGAIRRVASGNHYLSDATLNQLVSPGHVIQRPPHARNLVRPRIPDLLSHRHRARPYADRQRTQSFSQNRKQLSQRHLAENGLRLKCRSDPLRHSRRHR